MIFLKKVLAFLKTIWYYIRVAWDKRRKQNTCGSVGTGRRARLRILWLLQSCGFKSHLPHWTIRQGPSEAFGPCLIVQSRSEPWTHGSRSRLRLGRLVAWGPPDLTRPIFRMASVVMGQAGYTYSVQDCILDQKERTSLWVKKNTVYYTRIQMHNTGP